MEKFSVFCVPAGVLRANSYLVTADGASAVLIDCGGEEPLREAERLLREERALSIAQVAERCGFASSSAFIRVFAGTHGGTTPRQYREQLVDNS